MAYGVKLRVWGKYALFSRPEMSSERVSYDVMTPSAARGILEAIHWKPAIEWRVDKIHVINEIKFDNIRRNELKNKISEDNVKKAMNGSQIVLCQLINDGDERQQRASMILKDVEYVLEAHFEMTSQAGKDDNEGKHIDEFRRRARKGQFFHQPYFGCREFPVNFELIEDDNKMPKSEYIKEKYPEEIDLGYMLWDIDFKNNKMSKFFKAKMKQGTIITDEREVF